jgi:hypothetical protein
MNNESSETENTDHLLNLYLHIKEEIVIQF